MSQETIDATISAISCEGNFLTNDIRLEVYSGDLILQARDYRIIPGITVREKYLLISVPKPREASMLSPIPLTYKIFDVQNDYLLGETEFEFNPVINSDTGKVPYEVQVDIVEEADSSLQGQITIKYCVHPSTDFGKISDLIANMDCICRYLNDIKSGDETLKILKARIDALLSYLNSLGIGTVDYSTSANSVGYISDGTIYCGRLNRIKSLLQLILQDSTLLTNAQLLEVKKRVYDLYAFFNLNVPPDYCNPTGFLWPVKKPTHVVQSSELFIQASGSDGTDGVTKGMLLRWNLNDDLGANHLPKGKYATQLTLEGETNPYLTTAGYSDNDEDFIKIYKIEYKDPTYFTINFNQGYSGIIINKIDDFTKEMIVRVSDRLVVFEMIDRSYANITSQLVLNSTNGTYDCSNLRKLIRDYNDVFNISIRNLDVNGIKGEVLKSFSVSYSLSADDNAAANDVVLLNAFEGSEPDVKYNLKDVVVKSEATLKKFYAESIQKVHIKVVPSTQINEIKFEIYEDFLYKPQRRWELLNSFSLSLDDDIAEARLLGNSLNFNIDGNWPKYNDDVTTKVSNYTEKWLDPSEGFKHQIEKYLLLSKDDENLKAVNDDLPSVSFLNLLKLQSIDFHVARMLGFGTIDILDPDDETKAYIYLAYYKAPTARGRSVKDTFKEHIYLTLPTKLTDSRSPFMPSLHDFTHDAHENTQEVIDSNGYSHTENYRLININRVKYPYELASAKSPSTLLNDNKDLFNLGGINTRPYFIGIEYGLDAIDPNKELPTLIHNRLFPEGTEYKDLKNDEEVDENLVTLDRQNPIFTQIQFESGTHHYALYAVNWFSRASNVGLSSTLSTNFVKKTIKPPINLSAQYIQKEDPIVFTSLAEQTVLNERINLNVTYPNLTRVTFDWNGFQNSNYQLAKEVHFYFRRQLPKVIKGKTGVVFKNGNTNLYLVPAKSIKLISQDGSMLVPTTTNPSNFIGAFLKTESGVFKVVGCTNDSANKPTFEVEPMKNNRLLEVTDPLTNRIKYQTVENEIAPKSDEFFSVVENDNNSSDWYKLVHTSNKVVLTNFIFARGRPYTENSVNLDGVVQTQVIGGIFKGVGTVEAIVNSEMNHVYRIVISENLPLIPPNNGPNVNYFEGTVRLKTVGDNIRELKVFSISGFGTPTLTLLAFDPNHNEDDLIKTTGVNFINFHPGYRIYLQAEGDFIPSNVEPQGTQKIKSTWLSAKSFDSDNPYYVGNPFRAPFSSHVTLVATKTPVPLAPSTPIVHSKFATRPDAFGKSSYTFDIPLATEKPFATAVYRTTDNAILNALYSTSVLAEVKVQLNGIQVNNAEDLRFTELVNVVLNSEGTSFNIFNGYALPMPDLAGIQAGDTLIQKQNKIKQIIMSLFFPVTESPILYSFIKERNSGQTSNKKPVLTDRTGKQLIPSDSEFDPYPFVTKVNLTDGQVLRITDYTLQGTSKARYFFAYKHQASNLVMSNWSRIIGPVNLIDSSPFESPNIEKYEIVLGNKAINTNPSVRFSVLPYPSNLSSNEVRVFRTSDASAAKNILGMSLVGDFNILTEDIIDAFTGLTFPPTEEPIYYRMVGLRKVRGEKRIDETSVTSEFIIETYTSNPSEIIVVELPDNINPESPVLTCNCSGNNSGQLLNVVLKFSSVMYKGDYYLYKLNATGAWDLINQLSNHNNLASLNFNVGNLTYIINNQPVNHVYKVVARNRSGLFSLNDVSLNINNVLVPNAKVIGPSVIGLNKSTKFYTNVLNPLNVIEWRLNNIVIGNRADVDVSVSNVGTYQLVVRETNPSSGLFSTNLLTITAKPNPVPVIQGETQICTDTLTTYSTNLVIDNFYNWKITGGTILSGQGTHAIEVNWDEEGTGIVELQESNSGLIVNATPLNVNVALKPNPIFIAESTKVCTGKPTGLSANNYHPSFLYNWQLADGNIINQHLDEVTVVWNTIGIKTLKVTVTNGTCTMVSQEVEIEVVQALQPSTINGQSHPMVNTNVIYHYSGYQPPNTVEWNVSENGEIINGQGTDTIEVIWTRGGGDELIEARESNGACESDVARLDVYPQ
ncbi:MAG: hypothetical protein MUC81_00825 [Bacteroidia bacterium]|jgi:hypothetical protein|nr:hypothetical protein [Bacteroidia bacterium]